MSRAVLLDEMSPKCALTNGLLYPGLPVFRDPMITVAKSKDKLSCLRIDIERHPWRELAAICVISVNSDNCGPLAFHHLETMRACNQTYDIWTGGMQPKASQRQKILDEAQWIFNEFPAALSTTWINEYKAGVDLANTAVNKVQSAIMAFSGVYCQIQKLASEMNGRLIARARLLFWSLLDENYRSLLKASLNETENLNDSWYPIVRRAMMEAYRLTCPHESPRQLHAFAIGMDKLRLNKLEQIAIGMDKLRLNKLEQITEPTGDIA